MNAIKERILGAVTIMTDADAEKVWNFVSNNLASRSWDDIKEVSPDEWDEKMLSDIEKNPDCHEFISQDELFEKLSIEPDISKVESEPDEIEAIGDRRKGRAENSTIPHEAINWD